MKSHIRPGKPPKFTANSIVFLAAAATVCLFVISLFGCRHPRSKTPAPVAAMPVFDTESLMQPLTEKGAALFAGDASCFSCHQEIHRAHRASSHAITLRRVAPKTHGPVFSLAQTVSDKELNFDYRPAIKDGKCFIVDTTPAGETWTQPDLSIGSGRHGQTFLQRVHAGLWYDLRISYYTGQKRWGFTPLQTPGEHPFADSQGLKMDGDDAVKCIACHSTYLRIDRNGVDMNNSRFGIGCERCHGPGRAHVDSAKRQLENPKEKLVHLDRVTARTPDKVMTMCNPCHKTDSTDKPGDEVTERGLPRYQATALIRSRCFKVSKTLSCITCHSPHANTDPAPEKNDGVCLSCHGGKALGASQTVCKVNPRSGCVKCHMPLQQIKTIPYTKFHNHYIKVWDQKVAVRNTSRQAGL